MCKLASAGMGVCVSSLTKSIVDSYLSVYVLEAILEVITRGAPRNVRVVVHARSRVGMDVCIRVCLPFLVSSRQLLVFVCICMLTPLPFAIT